MHGAAVGHILSQGHDADHAVRNFLTGQHGNGGQNRSGAGHITLHGMHVGCRLQGNTARVKRDALSHEDERVIVFMAFRGVFKHDQAGRILPALSHGEVGVEPHVGELFLVVHRTGKRRPLSESAGLFGKSFGIHHVGRRIDEIARENDGISRILAPAGRSLFLLRHILARKIHGQEGDRLRVAGFSVLQSGNFVIGELARVDSFLEKSVHAAETLQCESRNLQGPEVHGPGAARAQGIGTAKAVRGHRFPPESDEHDARIGKIRMPVDEAYLILPSAHVAHGRGNDKIRRRAVQFRAGVGYFFSLTDRDKGYIGLPLVGSAGLKAYIHAMSPSKISMAGEYTRTLSPCQDREAFPAFPTLVSRTFWK